MKEYDDKEAEVFDLKHFHEALSLREIRCKWRCGCNGRKSSAVHVKSRENTATRDLMMHDASVQLYMRALRHSEVRG